MEGLSKIIKGLSRSSTSPHGSSCLKDNPTPQQYSLSSTRNRSSSSDGLNSPSTPAVGSPQCRRKWSLSSDSIKCDCEGGVQRADDFEAETAPGSSSSSTCVFYTIHTTTTSRQDALPPSSSRPYRQQERSASLPRRLKRRVIWSAKMLHKASKATNSASAAPTAGPQAPPSNGPAAYSFTGCEQQQQQLAQQFSPSCSPAANQPLLTTANGAPSKSSNSTPATQPVPLAMQQLQSHSSSDSAGNSTTAIAANSSSSNTLPHSSLKSACLQILRATSARSSSSSDSSSVCSGHCQPLPLPAQAAAPSVDDDSTLQGRWQGSTTAGQPQSYRQCSLHPDGHEPEIQPWSDGSDEDSLSGHGQSTAAASAAAAMAHPGRHDHTSSSHEEADRMDVDSLFDNSLPRSDSFTTTCYNTSKGQKVAVVRLGSVITSVFVREPTGEVWECPPDQVIIPETHHTQPATSHNPQPHSTLAAAAAAQHCSSSTVLTAEAAAKLYVSMNGGKASTHTHRNASAAGSADSSFSSRNSSSSLSPRHHSQCSTGTAGTPATHLHSVTEASTARGAGMTTNPTSSHRNRSKGGVHAWGLQSVFSYVKSSFRVWQQQRKLQKQCQAAAYIDAIDDAAHVAMRVAGCHSFVLPRYWPDSARKAVRQQRRLRVLLTAYKA